VLELVGGGVGERDKLELGEEVVVVGGGVEETEEELLCIELELELEFD
jgi:hypothetical protein